MKPDGTGLERRHLDRKTPWRLVKKYCRAAGIDPDRLGGRGIGIHSLRKTAINDAIRNGASLHEVREFAGHADIRELFTSAAYPVSEAVIAEVDGTLSVPARDGGLGRPAGPVLEVPSDVTSATGHEERARGRMVAVVPAVVLGTSLAVAGALERSAVSGTINTSLVERQHATDRGRNARKARRTSKFGKDWRVHEAMTDFTRYSSAVPASSD
jgi:hypothetical protein